MNPKKIWCLKFDLIDERISPSDKKQPVTELMPNENILFQEQGQNC